MECTNPFPDSSILCRVNRAHARAHFTSKFVLCIRAALGIGIPNGNVDPMETGQELNNRNGNGKQPEWE